MAYADNERISKWFLDYFKACLGAKDIRTEGIQVNIRETMVDGKRISAKVLIITPSGPEQYQTEYTISGVAFKNNGDEVETYRQVAELMAATFEKEVKKRREVFKKEDLQKAIQSLTEMAVKPIDDKYYYSNNDFYDFYSSPKYPPVKEAPSNKPQDPDARYARIVTRK